MVELFVNGLIFGFDKHEGLSVLLTQRVADPFKNFWAFPGGAVHEDELLQDALEREILEATGLEGIDTIEIKAFDQLNRWPERRVVSIAYYAFVRKNAFLPVPGLAVRDARWFSIWQVPELAFDHAQLLDAGMKALQNQFRNYPIGLELLEKKFLFSDFETMTEAILGMPIDRRNFKKKVSRWNILEELNEFGPSTGAGRPGRLFRLKKNKLIEFRSDGFPFPI